MNLAAIQDLQARVCESWLSHLGEPYYWGRMDCSHLVVGGHQAIGTWPLGGFALGYRTAGEIFLMPELLRIAWEDRQPADIVGFGDPTTGLVHHVVGVIVGELIGANSGGAPLPGETPENYVRRETLNDARVKIVGENYWASHRVGVRRVPMLDYVASPVDL